MSRSPKPPRKPPMYNFGAASSRDRWIFGCSRPGHAHPKVDTPRTPRGPPVEKGDLKKWIAFLRTRGIHHIISLLSEAELGFFAEPFLKTCASAGFTMTHVPPNDQGALEKLTHVMEHAERSSKRVVVHCASGQKRTGDVLALWLHRRYRLPVEQAVEEVGSFASDHRILRRPSVPGVLRLLAPKALKAQPPPLPPSWSIGTPRRASAVSTTSAAAIDRSTKGQKESDAPERRSFHVVVLQMGGEIDKRFTADGTKAVIGEPAVSAILTNLPRAGFSFETIPVCRKDGQHVSTGDRTRLIEMCKKIKTSKILVTHGTLGLVETALALRRQESLGSKTIVVTGASTPHCTHVSDSVFNIGVAFGALNVLRRGVFLCMNGRIFESSRCQYNAHTGIFTSIAKKGTSKKKSPKA